MTPQAHQEKIKKQIHSSYHNTNVTGSRFSKSEVDALNDMLVKGEISDALVSGYGAGNQPMIFTKTGKEIKEKIPAIIASLEAQKITLEAQITALKTVAGIEPTNPTGRRYAKEVPFARYDYKVCEPEYLGNNNYAQKTEQMDVCSKYNALIYVYNDILDDIDALNAINSNVEDSKKYQFTVSQLIAMNLK
jgi:hypothetical protein